MFTINFRRNILLNKNSPFPIQFNKYNKIIFKNIFYLNEVEDNKRKIKVNGINNPQNFIIKNFSRKIERKIFEDFSTVEKSIIKRNNMARVNNKKNEELKHSDYLDQNQEEELNYNNDLEKKLDNLFNKVAKSNFNYEKRVEEIFNLNNTESEIDEDQYQNLENFKKYVQSTIYIPKTDFNDRLNVKETELKQVNKITEDYYIEQLGIFKNPKNLRENNFVNYVKSTSPENKYLILNFDAEENSFNLNNKNKLWITHDIPTATTGKQKNSIHFKNC